MRGSTETRAGATTDGGTESDAGIGGDLSECVTAQIDTPNKAVKLNARKETASEESTTTETHGETT
jgi:hypothetical protein